MPDPHPSSDLTSLNPRIYPDMHNLHSWHEIIFLCPKCRKHEISVAFWKGPTSDAVQVGTLDDGTPNIKRLWHREGDGLHDLTLTPSINRNGCGDKCGGWHGFITNGKVQ